MGYITNFEFDKLFVQGMGAGVDGTASNNRLIVYKGTLPADADAYSVATYTADELVTFSGTFTLVHNWSFDPPFVTFGVSPTVTNASATGTAAWYAIYNTSQPTRVLLGEVSTSAVGTGTLFLDDVNIVSGNPVTAVSFGINFDGIG